MRAFFLRHKKLHLWLLADLCLLAAFLVLRENHPAMTALAAAMGAVRRGVGKVCYLTTVSVMEVLCALLVVLAAAYAIGSVVAVARRGERLRPESAAVKLTIGMAAVMSLVLCGFMLLACLVSGTGIHGGMVLRAAAPPWLLAAAVWLLIGVLSSRERRRRAYSALLGGICASLTIYAGFCYLWGVNYYVDSFQDQSGIYAQKVAAEDLAAVTWYFADRLNETAGQVERDENGLFAVPRQEIFDQSVHVYDETAKRFPFLDFEDQPPKAVRFSRLMSRMDFTGVYCPFTGESNVNVDSPACLLPSTIAHELAHQRGIASEQECNFLAILSSTTCGDAAYAYSGWLLGYIYLGNALYGEDPNLWEPVYQSLPEAVRLDLSDNNAYWRQFQDSAVKQASNKVYDSFLKGYGEEQGLKSYGTVVDLLVVYYKDLI